MYYYDAISTYFYSSSIGNYTIVGGNAEKTVLSIQVAQDKDEEISILCNNTIITKSFSENSSFLDLAFKCNSQIRLETTKPDPASVVITYLPYNASTTISGTTSQQSISSSSQFYVKPEFSGGDIVTILLLLVFLFMMLTFFIVMAISKIKTKRTYLQYNGGDVEIREDL